MILVPDGLLTGSGISQKCSLAPSEDSGTGQETVRS